MNRIPDDFTERVEAIIFCEKFGLDRKDYKNAQIFIHEWNETIKEFSNPIINYSDEFLKFNIKTLK